MALPVCIYLKCEISGASLVVQRRGLHASTQRARARSLVRELRSCKMRSAAKKKEFSGKKPALTVLRISNQLPELETTGFGVHSDNISCACSKACRSQDITMNQSRFLVSENSALTGYNQFDERLLSPAIWQARYPEHLEIEVINMIIKYFLNALWR